MRVPHLPHGVGNRSPCTLNQSAQFQQAGKNEETREHLFVELGADQFLEKFKDNREKAFAWAHLEKRRKVVSTLVRNVFVSRDKNGERHIAPEVVVDVPIPRNEILSYGYQAPDYRPTLETEDEQLGFVEVRVPLKIDIPDAKKSP